MNRPNELINELKEFDESFYGFEITECECKEIVNYIQKLEKALDKACKFIDDIHGSCPYDVKNFCTHKEECDGTYIKCWKEYLLKDE